MSQFDRRKWKLISPVFQLSFVGYLFFIFIFNATVILIMSYYMIFDEKRWIHQEVLDLNLRTALPMLQLKFVEVFLWANGITLFLTLVLGIFISHRFAGPIYRITQDLKGMAESGTLKNLHLRDKDYFEELPDYFNALVTEIEKKQIKK